MNKTEMMILNALANGAKIDDYKHLNKELHKLHTHGYVNCIFDEQNQVITGSITPKGKAIVHQ